MTCFACGREARDQCPRCGCWFCLQHGRGQCDRCRSPVSLLPSTLLFRSALALFVLALGLAGWHLIAWPAFPTPELYGAFFSNAPPEEDSDALTSSRSGEVPGTPQPSPTATPLSADTVTPTATPASATATPAPTRTATPAGQPRRYTVEPGDSLNGIAARFSTTVAALVEANNIADPTLIRVGQELVIP